MLITLGPLCNKLSPHVMEVYYSCLYFIIIMIIVIIIIIIIINVFFFREGEMLFAPSRGLRAPPVCGTLLFAQPYPLKLLPCL